MRKFASATRILIALLPVFIVVAYKEWRCLIGRHDWWYCDLEVPGHRHRHCRKCGKEE